MIDDGRNGFLFESGNPQALAKSMSALLAMNDGAITDMGRSARRKVEAEYNADLHYQRLMALYRRAINGSISNFPATPGGYKS
jgi:glycosyltransferase involved in cell wall biosynthesis